MEILYFEMLILRKITILWESLTESKWTSDRFWDKIGIECYLHTKERSEGWILIRLVYWLVISV